MKNSKAQKMFTDSIYYQNYYSGNDVGIFIGPVWVDDIANIQFTLNNNKAPVYGYMSEAFDGVSRGTYIIEGQFSVAYTEEGYIPKILEEYDNSRGDKVRIGTEADFGSPQGLPSEENYEFTRGSDEELDVDDSYRKYRGDKYGYIDRAYGNVVKRGFDIYITFGDLTERHRGGTAVMLNGCHITSRSIVAQPTGDPIAETYSFFAKDINNTSDSYDYISTEMTEQEIQKRARDEAEKAGEEIRSQPGAQGDAINFINNWLEPAKRNVQNTKFDLNEIEMEMYEAIDSGEEMNLRAFNIDQKKSRVGDAVRVYKEKWNEYKNKFKLDPPSRFPKDPSLTKLN